MGKQCRTCKIVKLLSEFYPLKRHRTLTMSDCKECWKGRQRRINQNRAERDHIPLPESMVCFTCKHEKPIAAFARNRTRARGVQSRCRECHRDRRYGLRPGEYDDALARQNGVCAICTIPSEADLEVDHDHQTGAFRGLLCGPCNRMLGAARDCVKTLIAAAGYLEGVV